MYCNFKNLYREMLTECWQAFIVSNQMYTCSLGTRGVYLALGSIQCFIIVAVAKL